MEALRRLRALLVKTPAAKLDMRDSDRCLLAVIERSAWFRERALDAAIGASYSDMWKLLAVDAAGNDRLNKRSITKAEVLANIDRLLAGKRALVYKALRS